MQRLTFILGALTLVALSGCDIGSVMGEEGKIRFRTDDNLFGEYPYAVGTQISVGVELLSSEQSFEGSRSNFRVQSDAPDVFEVTWTTPGSSMLLEAVGPGTANIEVSNAKGVAIDRFAISASIADRLSVSWPKPLSDLFGLPKQYLEPELSEVRMVEGGEAMRFDLTVRDEDARRLAGRAQVVVTMDNTETVDLFPEDPMTNSTFDFIPLASGQAQIHLEQQNIAAEIRVLVSVIPAESVPEIGWGIEVTAEAEEPDHVSSALLWFFLRDMEGEVVHGGHFHIFNETPELLSLMPEGNEGEESISYAIVGSRDVIGTALIRVEETVTGLSRVLELPVGPEAQEEDQESASEE